MGIIKKHCGSKLRDTLKVYFSPIMICQHHCTYCYARNDLASQWNNIMEEGVARSVIEILSKSTLPISLIFLGGEPTLYPHFLDLLDLWDELCNKDPNSGNSVEITTNGVRTDIFEEMRRIDNLTLTFSFHPREADFDEFFKSIQIAKDKGIEVFVNILILEQEYHYPVIRRAVAKAEEMGIPIQPTLLNGYIERRKKDNNKKQEDFIKEISLDKEGIVATMVEEGDSLVKKDFTLIDFYMQDHHFLKGVTCHQGAYNIDVYGRIKNVCLEEGADGIPIIDNPDYFSKINSLKPIECPLKSCNCSEYLIDFYKEVK